MKEVERAWFACESARTELLHTNYLRVDDVVSHVQSWDGSQGPFGEKRASAQGNGSGWGKAMPSGWRRSK